MALPVYGGRHTLQLERHVYFIFANILLHELFSTRQSSMIRVVIADDHQLVREGVKKVLSVDPEPYQVSGHAPLI